MKERLGYLEWIFVNEIYDAREDKNWVRGPGALENVLQFCSYMISYQGTDQNLDGLKKKNLARFSQVSRESRVVTIQSSHEGGGALAINKQVLSQWAT